MKNWTAEEIENQIEKYFKEDENTKKILGAESKFSGVLKSIISTIKRIFVDFVFGLITEVYNSIYYSTSDQDSLIKHLKDEGLTPWKLAKRSTGFIRIGSTVKPDGKIQIPLRTVIQTSDVIPKRYITTEASFIDENTVMDSNGFYTVRVSIESIETGGRFNVAEGAICNLDSSIEGIDYIYNFEQTSNGRDEETIDEVRERLIDRNVGKTEKTRSWFISETKNMFDWVVQCACIPRFAGRGTVGIAVRVAGGVDPTPEQLNSIENYFNTDEMDPAGAWQVYATKMSSYKWNATIKVYYSGLIPSNEELNTPLQEYFAGLSDSDEIIEDWIKASILMKCPLVKKINIVNHTGFNTPAGFFPVLGAIVWEKELYD